MALTKIPRGLLDTGIADSSDATAITIDSSENVTFAGNILKTGDLTVDVSGDIYFDADGTNIFLQDGGTSFANFYGTNTDFYIKSVASDKDIIFQGNDGGSTITALTLDMSAGGAASFNTDVSIPSHGITLNQAFGSGVPTMTMLGTAANGRAGAIMFQEQGAANTAAIYSTDGGTGNGSYGGLTIATYQSDLRFATNGLASTRMVISSAGMVTITPDTGATTGTLRLHNGNGNGTLGAIEFGHSGNVDHGSIQYTGNMDFFTGDSTTSRFFISSAGNVGINTSNPEHHLHVTEPGDTREDGIVKIGGSTTALGLELKYNQTGATTTEIVANPTYTNTASIMRLCVDRDANANQIVLTGQGNTGFGTDSPGSSRLYVYQDIDAVFTAYFLNDHTGAYGVGIRSDSDSMMYFYNGGTFRGRIYHNGSTMLYADQSDYRLKENVQTMTGSIDRIKKLNPVTFDWKADGKASEGFLAHEVQEVVPTAVSGEKDAEITEVGEGIQIMDYGKVTPVLVGALQEALAKIETLEAKVAALESK